jgi:hypothetical protein
MEYQRISLIFFTPLSTMPDITLFSPFSEMDNSWNTKVHILIQDIIFYAESRFWAILNEISNAEMDIDRRVWTQRFLVQELVRTFSFFLRKF